MYKVNCLICSDQFGSENGYTLPHRKPDALFGVCPPCRDRARTVANEKLRKTKERERQRYLANVERKRSTSSDS